MLGHREQAIACSAWLARRPPPPPHVHSHTIHIYVVHHDHLPQMARTVVCGVEDIRGDLYHYCGGLGFRYPYPALR